MAPLQGLRVFTCLLVIGALGAESAVLVFNRLILAAGVYKFPYPITTTLIQCIITYFFVLGAEHPFRLLLSFFPPTEDAKGSEVAQDALLPKINDYRPSPIRSLREPLQPGPGFRKPGTSDALWRVVRTTLPLALIYLLKVGLNNVFMTHVSLPAYLLLRLWSVPICFLMSTSLRYESCSAAASVFAVMATSSFFITILSYAEYVELGNLVLGTSLSIVNALLPIMFLRAYYDSCNELAARVDLEDLDEKRSIAMNSISEPRKTSGRIWSVLQRASFVSTLILTPLIFISGEIPHMLKNSYVLESKCLWQLLVATGLLNGVLFVVTFLLTTATSAATTTLLSTSSSAVLLAVTAFGSLTLYGWTGLACCWLFTFCFIISKMREVYTPEVIPQRLYSITRMLAFIVVVCWGVQLIGKFDQDHSKLLASSLEDCKTAASTSPDIVYQPYRKLGMGSDAYLGTRPDVGTVADIAHILKSCGEVPHGQGVDDVINCLSFLADHKDQYFVAPKIEQENDPSEKTTQALVGGLEDTRKYEMSQLLNSTSTLTNSTTTSSTCQGSVIPYHVYWTGHATWRFELFVKAYLYTQNLPCSRLWIWLDSDADSDAVDRMLCEDPIFQRFKPLVSRGDIVLKAWKFPHRIPLPDNGTQDIIISSFHPHLVGDNLEMKVADNIIQDGTGKWLLLDATSTAISPVQVSDAVRFIVLHLHGGVYLDMDVLLLRDMRPLLLPSPTTGQPVAFAEQWVERCPQSDYNTAIISLPANSSLSTYLLRGGVRMGMNFHPKIIGQMMWRDGRNDELKMLHNAVFDPLVTNLRRQGSQSCTVPCHKNFESAFLRNVDEAEREWSAYRGPQAELVEGSWPPTNRSMEHFFRGAWAYHIHNQWWKFPEPTSWMDIITRAQDGFFDGTRTNAYGETWEGPLVRGFDRETWP